MQATLSGKTALITGASSGIGAATARALSQLGASVILAARRTDRLEALAASLDRASTLALDVRDAAAVRGALESLDLDLVVCNAGLGVGVGPLQEGAPEAWDRMIDTNVKGVLHTLRATLPGLLRKGAGDVVLLGSVAGRQVYPGGNVYNATKHAVRAIYEALRLDAGSRGVRFTTVDPGMVETEFSVVRFGGDQAAADKVYAGMRPLDPEDVADAIAYAVTRPAHVNIGELVIWPTDQSSTRDVRRDA
ncbi:MAG: SDR family NAD(P)-dependent oxidoreductase [Planctomycetes bacterium]|nr:SDR family NAD(P)-dependent oxidoreductase [Planctomycetota bacterium]MCB9909160.1 SDR family NAD(P)-dependent oxidoreductase [Planctomycetota bacterium]